MLKSFNITKFLLLLLSLLPIATHAAETSPDATIMNILKAADQARGNITGIQWIIELHSVDNGREQSRTFKLKARDRNSLAEYMAPPRVKGRMLLMLDRNMWFLKPDLKKPVPISPRQKLSGNASNGDIASTNYAGDYKAESVSNETVNGKECYALNLVSTTKKATYDRIRYWIDKERNVGVKAEFYTVSGKLLKTAMFEYGNTLQLDEETRPFISKMVITDAVVRENITTLIYKYVQLKNIPDSTFNLNLLKR
jgi:outer membrane lipoprotein-sorting protein